MTMNPTDPKHCLCTSLRKAARAITQRYDTALRTVGIRATQLAILVAVAQEKRLTLSQLADVTVTDRTTLTRNLKLLRQRGVLIMEHGEDRRERYISLTANGEALLNRASPRWLEIQTAMVDALGQRQFERLVKDLERMIGLGQKE